MYICFFSQLNFELYILNPADPIHCNKKMIVIWQMCCSFKIELTIPDLFRQYVPQKLYLEKFKYRFGRLPSFWNNMYRSIAFSRIWTTCQIPFQCNQLASLLGNNSNSHLPNLMLSFHIFLICLRLFYQ